MRKQQDTGEIRKALTAIFGSSLNSSLLLYRFFDRIQSDARIGAAHIALFSAMVQLSQDNLTAKFYGRELRQMAKICSPRTYFKTLRDLQECQYIEYTKGISRWQRSQVLFIV